MGNTLSSKNKRFVSVDNLRFWAAWLVVSIHCWKYFGRDVVVPYARIAVPLFFMISGYFLFNPASQQVLVKITRSIKKVSAIWAIGTIAFCIDFIFKCRLKQDFSVFVPTWQTPVNLVVFCHQKIGFPLWFLLAMMEGLCAMYLMTKYQWDKYVKGKLQWIAPCVLVTIGVLLNKYLCAIAPIDGNPDLQYPPLLFMSWPFLYLGFVVHKEQEKIQRIFISYQYCLWIIIGIFSILTFFEGHFAPKGGDSYLCTLFLVIPIFLLVILHPTAGFGKIAEWGRMYSLWIYVFHVIVYSVLQRQLGTYNHWLLHPVSIFFISFAWSIVVDWVVNRFVHNN